MTTSYCSKLFSSEELIQQLKKEGYRVAIIDLFLNECNLALANELDIPTVGYWPSSFVIGPAYFTPAFNPPSVSGQAFSFVSDSMTFMERVSNTMYFLVLYFLMQLEIHLSNSIIKQYLPHSPHPSELLANMSGMLISTHPAISYPILLPPSYLEIGGMHLRESKALPQDILAFIESSGEHGVIVFSMGFSFDSKDMPQYIFEKYLTVFGRFKQKVLVKSKVMPSSLPPNVKIYSFFPQADILSHNKTVLFISHCGTFGVIEAIRNEVPIVGIPFFYDHMENLLRLKQHGVAEELDKEATSDEIYDTINSVINDSRYKENMKILSKKFKSFEDPLEKAIWLIEHVIETNGAPHLKLGSRHLGILQYLCLDVLLFMLASILAVIFAVYKLFTYIRRKLIRRFEPNTQYLGTKIKSN